MIRKILCVGFLTGLCCQISLAGVQDPATAASKPQAKGQAKEDPLSRFRWLAASGETRGQAFEARRLESLKVAPPIQDGTETESEVTRPAANSMRTTRRMYSRSVNGERQLVAIEVEDVRTTAGDGLSATRTVSRRDANGGMRVAEKEVQEMVPTGAGTFRTQATTMYSTGNDNLTASKQVVQTEKKRADGVVDIERTQMLPGGNGGWATAERRVSSTREANNEIITQEEVYRQDANGKFALSQKGASREYKDSQGRINQDKETYTSSLAGSLELSARSSIVRTTYADGTVETAQTLLQRSPAAPSEGLKLAQKIQEILRAPDANTTERETEVLAPDPNGKMQSAAYWKIVEKK